MDYPGRERVEECARSFGELADIYYRMPCRKEGFGRQDIEDIFEELTGTVCRGCRSFGKCWKDQAASTYQRLYEALTAMGEGKTEGDIRAGMSDACIRAGKMAGSMVWAFRNMRMKLYYANRLLEGREAVADQLWEMARLLDDMAEEMQRTGELKEPVNRRLCRLFDRRGAQVRKIFLMHKRKRRDELYITMHARKGECVPIRDLAGILSVVLHRRMVPARNSRTVLGAEDETVLFVEETRYCLLYGISRVPKEGELLSGDSFSYFQNDQGAAVLSLSDGMGSGREAAAESRKLIELLEQFLEAGVSEETALGLINSASVYEKKSCSTLDICSVDLYSGSCDIRKLGAAPTFLRRDGQVEIVQSFRTPAGLFHHLDPETQSFRLGDGDTIVLVTDGALDVFSGQKKEEQFAALLEEQTAANPRELAAALMEQLMERCQGKARDDMTVFVGGLWQRV